MLSCLALSWVSDSRGMLLAYRGSLGRMASEGNEEWRSRGSCCDGPVLSNGFWLPGSFEIEQWKIGERSVFVIITSGGKKYAENSI